MANVSFKGRRACTSGHLNSRLHKTQRRRNTTCSYKQCRTGTQISIRKQRLVCTRTLYLLNQIGCNCLRVDCLHRLLDESNLNPISDAFTITYRVVGVSQPEKSRMMFANTTPTREGVKMVDQRHPLLRKLVRILIPLSHEMYVRDVSTTKSYQRICLLKGGCLISLKSSRTFHEDSAGNATKMIYFTTFELKCCLSLLETDRITTFSDVLQNIKIALIT